MANVRKKFQIEVLKDREVNLTYYKKVPVEGEEKRYHLEVQKKSYVVPESYMVYFPGGHSVWFETKEAMQRAGIIEHNNVDIDLDTGLPVAPPKDDDLKTLVQRKTQQRGPATLRSL